MTGFWAIAGGLVLTGLGWAACRYVARARPRLGWALALDLAGPFGLFAILFAAAARPLFAGAASLAVFAGFAFADAVKRRTLLEPVVFSDMSEFVELFRHPGFYLPFAGPGLVIGGAAAIFAALAAIAAVEAGLWPWSVWPGLAALGIAAATAVAAGTEPRLSRLARFARRLGPSADPGADARRLGPLAILPIHGTIARAERPARRAALTAPAVAATGRGGPPVVIAQCESFFDARRLHPAIPADLLPGFDGCAANGIASGRFKVGGWGAYTIRAELAALTGFPAEAYGFDRWNPYHAFLRAPLPSLASRFRDLGYRTVCLHPFDRTYYSRHKIMPRLGFDVFLGAEAFAGAERAGAFVADAAVARRAAALLREDGGRGLFLFVITMENHGPWRDRPDLPEPAPELPPVPERGAVQSYLRAARHTDAMLAALRDTLAAMPGSLLAAYGDHLPSLPRAYRALGFTDSATDYAIWSAAGGGGARRDIAAHELPAAILAARAIS